MSSIVQCAHGHITVYFNSARMVTICTTSNWLYTSEICHLQTTWKSMWIYVHHA